MCLIHCYRQAFWGAGLLDLTYDLFSICEISLFALNLHR